MKILIIPIENSDPGLLYDALAMYKESMDGEAKLRERADFNIDSRQACERLMAELGFWMDEPQENGSRTDVFHITAHVIKLGDDER